MKVPLTHVLALLDCNSCASEKAGPDDLPKSLAARTHSSCTHFVARRIMNE